MAGYRTAPGAELVYRRLTGLHAVYGGHKAFLVRNGYAMVYVDVRGTGASFGTLRYPWDPLCIQDASEILDWIIAQPWSNGRVAGLGISYLGTTAELLLATRHPALKAVIPMYNHPDPYVDIAFQVVYSTNITSAIGARWMLS